VRGFTPAARSLKPIPEFIPRSPAAIPDRADVGDTYDERPPVWDDLERIVGYRVTDENQAQAFRDAHRSPLDRLYDEHVAAKRQREPKVIVRYGIDRCSGCVDAPQALRVICHQPKGDDPWETDCH
jgi:hypothetical protein